MRFFATISVLSGVFLLAGCSADPGGESVEGADFPVLSESPDRPDPAAITETYEALSTGLAADRENARYLTESLRAEAEPSATPPLPGQVPEPQEEAVPEEVPEELGEELENDGDAEADADGEPPVDQ